MTDVLIGKREGTLRRRPCEDGSRGRSDIAMSHGISKIPGGHQLGTGKERFSPEAFIGSRVLLTF